MKAGKVILLLIGIIFLSYGAKAQYIIDTLCVNHSPGHLAVPNTPGSIYHWTVSGGKITSGNGTSDITVSWGSIPGYFPVTVTETSSLGCPGDTRLAYVYLAIPYQALIEGPTRVCPGEEVTLFGKAGSNFIWNNGKRKSQMKFRVFNDTTVYQVALNGPCRNDTFYHRIELLPAPRAKMHPLEDTLNINAIVDLFFTGSNAQKVDWMIDQWDIGSGFYLSHQFTGEGEYEIIQIAYSGSCTDTIKSKVYIKDDFAVHIPNAFTPNDDGTNDRFIFLGVGMKSYVAEVYDRWGEMLYTWTNEDDPPGWDGTYRGMQAKVDSYVYKIIVEDYRGTQHRYRGYFTLIR